MEDGMFATAGMKVRVEAYNHRGGREWSAAIFGDNASGAAIRPTARVVARIEGQDTLYEFDLSAAPSREWRAAFRPMSPSH